MRLEEGAGFILDAAPFVDGHPADYAYAGTLGPSTPRILLGGSSGFLKQIIRSLSPGGRAGTVDTTHRRRRTLKAALPGH